MGIDIHFSDENTGRHRYIAEVTEDYEGDKFHVVVFDNSYDRDVPNEHYDTQGFENIEEVYNYIKNLQNKTWDWR